DPPDGFVLVGITWNSVGDLAARIVRCRQILQHLHGRRIEHRSRNLIPGKRRARERILQLHRPVTRFASRGRDLRKIARFHRWRRHVRNGLWWIRPLRRGLKASKKEELVLNNSPAERPAP